MARAAGLSRSTARSCPSPTARRTWPSTPSSAAAATATPATRCCGCWPWSAAAPAPSSTPCSAPSRPARPLTPAPARQPARGDAPARRPELRRRLPGRADRRGQGRLPDPRPHREQRPETSRPAPPARRVLAVALRRRPGPGHRRPGHRHHQRRAGPDGCRLVTTLLDPARYPAGDLAVLYHERWEIETAYFELKSTILGGRVLRARTPDGIEQEVYALLVTYQALRTAIADAAAPSRAPTPAAPASPSP